MENKELFKQRVDLIRQLNSETGIGIMESKKLLEKYNFSIRKAKKHIEKYGYCEIHGIRMVKL